MNYTPRTAARQARLKEFIATYSRMMIRELRFPFQNFDYPIATKYISSHHSRQNLHRCTTIVTSLHKPLIHRNQTTIAYTTDVAFRSRVYCRRQTGGQS